MANNIPSYSAIKRYVDANVPMGLSQAQILTKLLREHSDMDAQGKKTLEVYVSEAILENGSYEEIQQYMNGVLLAPHDQKDGYYLLNPQSHAKRFIKKSVLKDILSPKLDIKSRIIPCYFDYRPFVKQEIFKEAGQTNYNSYEPPFWLKPSFYAGTVLPRVAEMPEIHKRMLEHLLGGDAQSIDYVIKWLANSLQGRNRCYLVTIAQEGIGKGVLGEVMKALHGDSNYTRTIWGKVKEMKFNSILFNKRIIYIDEIDIKNKSQEDLIKDFTNDTMDVELKGVDSRIVQNYASLYLSSNHLDSLRISPTDRRMSIVEMTETKLPTVFTPEEIDLMYKDPNTIEQLALFLMGVELDQSELLAPFISARTALVREASITDMEDYIINEYCKTYAGKDVPVEELQNHLSEKFGAKFKPTTSYLSNLSTKMPGHYKVHRPTVENGARPRKLKIEELKNQPPTNYELTK